MDKYQFFYCRNIEQIRVCFIGISYSQPKLDADAVWNPVGETFANFSANPWSIHVNTNSEIFVTVPSMNRIYLWLNGSVTSTGNIFNGLNNPASLFVLSSRDIYIDNGNPNGRIDRWISNTNTSIPAMYVGGSCYGLFLDRNNSLYCSINSLHRVVKKSLNDLSNITTTVAGIGCIGSTSYMLNYPTGIFVDTNSDLYVADYGNNRIQMFKSGQLNGSTVAGSGTANLTITLNGPRGIVLDLDKYLFIVDQNNHRIVGSSSNGFRCLVGCWGSGPAFNQLNSPYSMAFDNIGNLYVSDSNNRRILKFLLLNKTLSKFYDEIQSNKCFFFRINRMRTSLKSNNKRIFPRIYFSLVFRNSLNFFLFF